MGSFGVIYVASGPRYAKAAMRSAQSLRKLEPNCKIDLFTEQQDKSYASVFDIVHNIAHPHQRSKVDFLGQSRFDRTIYLDNDVRIIQDFNSLFWVLDRFDIAMTHDPSRMRQATQQAWDLTLPHSFPQYNSGVIAFRRNDAVTKFLNQWRDSYHTAGFRRDQITLRELLWLSDLRIATLPPEYNVMNERYLRFWAPTEAQPKILHFNRFHDEPAPMRDLFCDGYSRARETLRYAARNVGWRGRSR